MVQEQIFQLKGLALEMASRQGDYSGERIDLAETIYQWLTKEAQEAEAAKQAAKVEALSLVSSGATLVK